MRIFRSHPSKWRTGLSALLSAAAVTATLASVVPPAGAQVTPSAAEVGASQGLHAAAHRGDMEPIEKLVAAKADVNARDGHGRTPIHVATFARQHAVLRALARAAAGLELLCT